MTTTYTVTASNSAFWQSLVVVAYTKAEAADKFHTYLTTPEALAGEIKEYEMARDVSIRVDREDFRYAFSDFDIEIFEGDKRWTGTPSETVQMMDSGANG